MMDLRIFLSRVFGLFKKRGRVSDLHDEMEEHVALLAEENVRRGMAPDEARSEAYRTFGGMEQIKEIYRDRLGFPLLESVMRDVRYAIRGLLRSPGFTLVAVASLGLGISFNTAVFALVDGVLFREPFGIARSDRLVDIYTSSVDGSPYQTTSYPDYLDFKAQTDAFTDVIAYSPISAAVASAGPSRILVGEVVTGNYFRSLGINAVVGRTLQPEDDRPDAPRAVMISNGFWQREFAASPNVLGRTMRITGQTYTIVGVAPEGFAGMTLVFSPEIWTPMARAEESDDMGISEGVPSPGANKLERRGQRWLFVKGRLRDGQTIERAGTELQTVMGRLAAAYPGSNKARRVTVVRSDNVRLHPQADTYIRTIAAALMTIVGLVLLVACANVAGMLLARASGRRKEVGIRLAIGGSRRRIMRQFLTESVVLSAFGALAGLGLGWVLLRSLVLLAPSSQIPLSFPEGQNGHVFWFTVSVSLLAGIIAGLAPAIDAARINVMPQIKGDAPTVLGGKPWSLRDALVGLQMAVTMVLLVAAALLTRSTVAVQYADLGFRTEGVAVVNAPVSLIGYDAARREQFYNAALERIRALPGVEAVALTRRIPLEVSFTQDNIVVPGVHQPGEKGVQTDMNFVTPEYFETIGVPLVNGRNFGPADTRTSRRVAVISAAMAKRYWPNESAVGKRFRLRTLDGPEVEVIGVSADYKVRTVGENPTPYIHYAAAQGTNQTSVLLARTRGDVSALVAAMRRELLAIDPDVVLFPGNSTLKAAADAALLPTRLAAGAVSAVGAIAMLIAAVGLYGVMAYSVARRSHEIAVRMALGARSGEIVRQFMRKGLTIALAGALAGAVLAFGAARILSSVLYGVSPTDPVAWASAIALLVTVCSFANALPARRAARLDPIAALRRE